mgnify:CR=1 FL=1
MSELLQVYLMVNDLDRSRFFYEKVIGLLPRNIGRGTCAYETGGCELKLQVDFNPTALKEFNLDPPKKGNRGDGSVYVIRIEEEIEQIYKRIGDVIGDSEGLLITEPREVPWGESMFLLRDPDGYLIEMRGSETS